MALTCALFAAGCSASSPGGVGRPLAAPAPGCSAFAERGLLAPAESRARLRAALGEPDSEVRSPVVNRHVPGQVDTLVTSAYAGLAATYYVLPDRDLPVVVEVTQRRWLLYSAPTIGDDSSGVRGLLGDPAEEVERAPGRASWRYECGEPLGAEEPFFVQFDRATVSAVRFTYYID